MSQLLSRPAAGQNALLKLNIVDTDVHERADPRALVPSLEPMYRKYITDFGWVPERILPFAQYAAGGLDRADAKLPDGRPGGSDYGLLRKQLLDEYNIDYAILTGWLNASALGPGWAEFKTALMSAYNDWAIANWLEKDDRLLGSIHVNCHDPQGAAREIDRLGDHPRMVQVMLYIGDKAYGDPFYLPIFEAAARHELPVGIHHSENSPVPLGFHRYYIEWHTLVPTVFMAEITSLIFNGVLDRWPNLKVVMV